MSADIRVSGSPGSSVYLFSPVSEAGHEFVDTRIGQEANFFGGAVVVEHRYILDLIEGARSEGYDVVIDSNLVN